MGIYSKTFLMNRAMTGEGLHQTPRSETCINSNKRER